MRRGRRACLAVDDAIAASARLYRIAAAAVHAMMVALVLSRREREDEMQQEGRVPAALLSRAGSRPSWPFVGEGRVPAPLLARIGSLPPYWPGLGPGPLIGQGRILAPLLARAGSWPPYWPGPGPGPLTGQGPGPLTGPPYWPRTGPPLLGPLIGPGPGPPYWTPFLALGPNFGTLGPRGPMWGAGAKQQKKTQDRPR